MKGAMASDDKVRAALDRLDRDGDEHGVVEIISTHIDHLTAEVSRLEISLGEAWAYAQSCRVREELRAEASRLTTEVKVLSDALHLANSEVSRLEGERDAANRLAGEQLQAAEAAKVHCIRTQAERLQDIARAEAAEAECERLRRQLMECFALAVGDTAGDDSIRVADFAVEVVRDLRACYEERGNELQAAEADRDALRQDAERWRFVRENLDKLYLYSGDELAEVTQTWTDDDENVWEVPTAWAYAQSCRVREELRAEASRLTTEVKVLSDALHLANSEVSRLEGERDALLDLLGQARPCVWHAMAAAVNEPVAQKAEALLTAIDTARGDG